MTSRQFAGLPRIFKIHHVIDGDTFVGSVENWPSVIGHKIRIRLARIDCPELNADDATQRKFAEAAKMHLQGLLLRADRVVIRDYSRCKYFRLIAEVWADDVNCSDAMIEAGFCWLSHAKPPRSNPGRVATTKPPDMIGLVRSLLVHEQPPDELEWLLFRNEFSKSLVFLEKRGKNLTKTPEPPTMGEKRP